MSSDLIFAISALAALIPLTVVSLRAENQSSALVYPLLGVALAGPLAWSIVQIGGRWQTGFSTTLWVVISVTLVIFAVLSAITPVMRKLTGLLFPYLVLLAALATIWQAAPGRPMAPDAPSAWVAAHIVTSVVTYGLITIGAVAALAAFLQERALKAKHPTRITRRLPSVMDSEGLLVRLLIAGEAVLALGLATGMGVRFKEVGTLLSLDHKTLLSLAAFVVIGGLLAAHYRAGLRGRTATRLVLLAYLLLTLGYPGVKFVTDVLLRSGG